ncbi:DegQ family serine endoprotease [Halomonas sp. WWR20]
MERITRQFSPWLLAMLAFLAVQVAQARDLPDFTQLVKQAAPGVVNISTTRAVPARSASPFGPQGQEIPDIFRHFFGDQFPQMPGSPGQGSEERHSLGSGFVISEDGYVMTNAHVVDGADEIVVSLNDHRELQAELIGADKKTDVALLKIDAQDLPVLKLGNSDELEVGEWVAAIGSPFGFDHSVTAGIVSAINRTLPSDTYVPFIQTDVAINPGNSGGPLFNLDGEVVGINSQIFTRSGGFMGLSFAIPISVAMNIADQLRTEGRVSRGWLGVVIQPVSQDLAESFGLKNARGALVADVAPESPAAQAGLQAGDVILNVNGEDVESSMTLPRLIGRVSPGEEVQLGLMRNGESKQLEVEVGNWPEEQGQSSATPEQQGSQARLGISVRDLTEQEREQLDIDSGVLVNQVDPSGAAAKSGISSGDIIVTFDQKPVESAEDLMDAIDKASADRAIPVRIIRDGRPLFVALRLAEAE